MSVGLGCDLGCMPALSVTTVPMRQHIRQAKVILTFFAVNYLQVDPVFVGKLAPVQYV